MLPYDIVTIQLFVAVAKTGSIAGAARQQHIAASAVSHRIHELELATGTKLLNRQPRGVELTAAGRVFMERGTRILNELRDLDKDLKQFAEGAPLYEGFAKRTTDINSRLRETLNKFG
jgi:molybdate transport repressor ModE-like protein